MLLKMYVIHDSASETFCSPFFFGTRGEALRSMIVALNDPQTSYSSSPGDFTLFESGEFDTSTGVTHFFQLENLGNGVALKARLKPLSEAPASKG